MNLLLDTHIFLWTLFSPEKLSRAASDVIKMPAHIVSVSVLSFWEISLKYALGKLALTGVSPEELPDACLEAGFEILIMEPSEASSFHRLPRISHHDPFDRLLVWQAISRDMIFVSKDRQLTDYKEFGLKILW